MPHLLVVGDDEYPPMLSLLRERRSRGMDASRLGQGRKMPILSRKFVLVIAGMLLLSLAAVACSDGETPFATVAPTATTPAGAQPTATTAPSNGGGAGDAAHGQELFQANACAGCHSTGSNTIVGPGLGGVGERRDDAYLHEAIKSPGAVIAEGFQPLMPTFPGLSDSDIDDLVAYLKTLQAS